MDTFIFWETAPLLALGAVVALALVTAALAGFAVATARRGGPLPDDPWMTADDQAV